MSNLVATKSALNGPLLGRQANHSAVFRAYDIRGVYGLELDPELAYKLTKSFLALTSGKRYVIAYDMRSSSKDLALAMMQAILEENLEIDCLGMTTTDTLYYVVGKKGYDGGIMITASHNSAKFNGIKFVKSKAAPVLIPDLKNKFEELTESLHYLPMAEVKPTRELDLTAEFVNHVLAFAGKKPYQDRLKVIVDAGNGVAGIAAQPFFEKYPNIELIKMYFEPHPDFPHHEANPAITENMAELKKRVITEQADLGVAFDGDGDRVFFVDRTGRQIPGYYIQSLLTEYFLLMAPGETVVYDLRYTKAIESICRYSNGRGVVSKAGHSFIKQVMAREDAIFGGESTSSHFYYRDNYYADSGLITLQLILRIINETGNSLDKLVQSYLERFFISDEQNFYLEKPEKFAEIIGRLKNEFASGAFSDFDGLVIDFADWRFSLRQSNTEPFLRLNIEANSQSLLEEKRAGLFNILQEYATYTASAANTYALATLDFDKHEKLSFLFDNLYYTWSSLKGNYLDDLYKQEWARNQTPKDILRQIDEPVLDAFYDSNRSNIEETIRLQETYLEKPTWFNMIANRDRIFSTLETNPIAYFSLEYGLVDWLQIYSGGLGILAGDTLKEASDSGLPLIAVGLFYAQGYFYQRFTQDGWQIEDYLGQDSDDYPLETIKDDKGYTLLVDVKLGDHIVKVKGWKLKVGRRVLVLLDTNIHENQNIEDRMITYHLYGGDQDTRIKQEIILAIGGYKLLTAAGIRPSILHLNEGHSAFAILAQAHDLMQRKGLNFEDAITLSRKNILFTNHTLKQAGNDVFPYELVEQYLASYAQDFNTDFRHIFSLGIDPAYAEGRFGMTILGLNNAAKVNAVSKIHAVAAKSIWPDHEMIPVTNGVHLPSWVSAYMHELLDEFVSERWGEQGATINWEKVNTIPDKRIWNAHLSAKRQLIAQIKYNCGFELSESTLIFGWFRRFTAYKQPEVLTLDPERLSRLISDTEHPVAFVFGGKAHPRDNEGKEILQNMWKMSQEERFRGKLIIIPDYNWRMARYMTSGSDVWINSPVRFQEACGTSGMKAGANGLLQLSTRDGWIDEIASPDTIWELNDSLDANEYFSIIEQKIIPLFWDRNESGIPQDWIRRMKEIMKVVLSNYGTDRMLREYLEKLYKPLLKDSEEILR